MLKKKVLPQGYYLPYFERICSRIEDVFLDLLGFEDKEFLSVWKRLNTSQKYFVVRMIMRVGIVFRSDKFKYAEIENFEVTLQSLVNLKLVSQELTEEETLQITLKKEKNKLDSARVNTWKFLHSKTVEKFLLLYFANRQQSLTDFILQDLEVCLFEKYSLSKDLRWLSSLQSLDDLLEFYNQRELFWEKLEADDVDIELKVKEFEDYVAGIKVTDSLRRKLEIFYFEVGNFCSLEKKYLLANELLRKSNFRGSRERLLKNLNAQRNRIEAANLAAQMLLNPQTTSEYTLAQKHFSKVASRKGFQASLLPNGVSEVQIQSLVNDLQEAETQIQIHKTYHVGHRKPGEVEADVLQHFQLTEEFDGIHSENFVLCAISGLVYWNCVFANITGAFVNEFQDRPKDFGSAHFFEARLKQMESAEQVFDSIFFINELKVLFESKKNMQNPFVVWSAVQWTEIEVVLNFLPRSLLKNVCSTIFRNPYECRKGLPDLFCFKQTTGEWFFCEVKGPGDSLSAEQRFWLKKLRSLGATTKIARVSYAIVKR